RERDRIAVGNDGRVRRRDESRLGRAEARHLRERNEPVPLPVRVMRVADEEPVATARDAAEETPPDGTVDVAVDVVEVERSFVDPAERVDVLIDRTGRGESEVALEEARQIAGNHAQRQVDSVGMLPSRIEDPVLAALPL